MALSRSSWVVSLALVAGFTVAGWPSAGHAQTGTVTGTVVDAQSARPLPYANVTIVGTRVGTLTDDRGRFTLVAVPAGTLVLRAAVIGYAAVETPVTLAVDETATVTIELTPSAIRLDELVVTGQAMAVARRELATNVATISRAEIEAAPVTSVDQLIQGRVAGGTVNAVSAQPGTAGLVSFRGIGSVFGSQTPVIYVDGVRVDNSSATASGTGGENSSALADLLTSEIERVEVTRGGAASTLYGSDAAAGVIQIFTKRGRPGPPQVTLRVEQGFDAPQLKYMFDSELAFPNEVEAGEEVGDFLRRNYFRTGHHQNYALQVSGGTPDVAYHVSGRIQQVGGVQPKNTGEVFALRGNLDAQLSPTVSLNFAGTYTNSSFGRLYNGTAIADPLTAFEVGDAKFLTATNTLTDAFEAYLLPDIDEGVNRFMLNTSVDWRPSERFQSRLVIGQDYRTSRQRQFQPIGFVAGGAPEGEVVRFDREFQSITLEYWGALAHRFSPAVTSTFAFGVQGFRENLITETAIGTGFALPGTPDFDDAADIAAFEDREQIFSGGGFGQARFGFWDRAFLETGLRLDANSTFGDQVKVKAYPKLGATYLPSEEDFWANALGGGLGRIVDELKLRLAWGQTGKFPPPFLRDRTFSAIPFRGESAPRFDNPGNVDLAPEVTTTLEFGFDIAAFDNRLGFALTRFDARTRDALFFVPEPPLTGLGTQIRNVGHIRNKGFELDASVQVLNTRNVSASVRSTFSTLDNDVTDLGGAPAFLLPGVSPGMHVNEGHPVGAFFVLTPVDTNDDGLLDGSQRLYTGKGPTPTRSGSVGATVTLWNRLTLNGLADWAAGHEVMDWGSVWAWFNGIVRREILEDYEYPVQHELDGTAIGQYFPFDALSEFIVPGDFWKLREISARFALPQAMAQRYGANRVTVFASVRNVAIFSKTKMVDPELNGVELGGDLQLGGQSSVTLSPPRQFRLGIEATF